MFLCVWTGERVGALHMLCQSRDESERVLAHLKVGHAKPLDPTA